MTFDSDHLTHRIDEYLGRCHTLQLIVNGPYLEFALDGEVVLATLSAEFEGGQVGIWAVDGKATLQDITISPLRRPEHR